MLNLKVGKVFALHSLFPSGPKGSESLRPVFPISLHLVLALIVLESLRPAFSISLHLVLALNVGKVFALPSLFPCI